MKQLRFLATILAATLTFVLFSCGSGGEKKTEETATDTSKTRPSETTAEKNAGIYDSRPYCHCKTPGSKLFEMEDGLRWR